MDIPEPVTVHFDICEVPEQFRGGLWRWVSFATTPGEFLIAVICNDLKGVVNRIALVDDSQTEFAAVRSILMWFHNYAPATSFGSRHAYEEWSAERGWGREYRGEAG